MRSAENSCSNVYKLHTQMLHNLVDLPVIFVKFGVAVPAEKYALAKFSENLFVAVPVCLRNLEEFVGRVDVMKHTGRDAVFVTAALALATTEIE